MEYTEQNYEEDKKISNYVFNKYFKNNLRFREDLIQESLMKLWQGRQKFDDTKGQYSTWAFKVSSNSMKMFLRGQKKHINNLSLDYQIEIGKDNDCSDLIDMISSDEIDTDLIDLKYTLSKVFKGQNKDTLKMIDMIAKGFTQKEIAKEINKSQACVSRNLEKFKNDFVKER